VSFNIFSAAATLALSDALGASIMVCKVWTAGHIRKLKSWTTSPCNSDIRWRMYSFCIFCQPIILHVSALYPARIAASVRLAPAATSWQNFSCLSVSTMSAITSYFSVRILSPEPRISGACSPGSRICRHLCASASRCSFHTRHHTAHGVYQRLGRVCPFWSFPLFV
jgi:hypothetical protein